MDTTGPRPIPSHINLYYRILPCVRLYQSGLFCVLQEAKNNLKNNVLCFPTSC